MPASYDWKGLRYEWHLPFDEERRAALDVERLDTPRPKCLVPPGWTMAAFLAAWTRAEVMAKLFDTPIPVWIKANPLKQADLGRWSLEKGPSASRCRIFTGVDRSAGIVFSCGWALQRQDRPQRAPQAPVCFPGAGQIDCEVEHGGSHDDQF